jgi:ubiquinone/menaquinone biosynthesis C-methylase UbiE
MINEFLTTRYFTTNDKRIENVIFPLPRHWWSRFYEYAWAAEFCKESNIVLDAACGIPHPFKFYLAEKCKEVYAVDRDINIADTEVMDKQMKSVLGHSLQELKPSAEKVVFKHANLSELPCSDGLFNTIFCISALEHMSNDKKIAALKEFKRTLKDDGKIVLTIDFCKNKDYGSMTIDELESMAKESGLKFAGEVDKIIPANAITWQNNLYCFRAVLVKSEPEKKNPAKTNRKKSSK